MNVGTWDHKTLVLQLAHLLYNLHSGASLQGTSWEWALCPLYSGASLQGTSWGRVLCPLYSGTSTSWGRVLCPRSLSTRDKLGTGPLSLIQWSLSTRDKLGTGPLSPYPVEPLYKGQVGDGSFVPLSSGTSLQGTSWGRVLCPLIQWNLSTRDGSFVPLSSGTSLQGTSWGRVLCPLIQWNLSTRDKLGTGPYPVEPLYKGQVGDGSFVPLSSGTSLQETSWERALNLSLIQWNLQKGTSWGWAPFMSYACSRDDFLHRLCISKLHAWVTINIFFASRN